jgi:hypothetical protein
MEILLLVVIKRDLCSSASTKTTNTQNKRSLNMQLLAIYAVLAILILQPRLEVDTHISIIT